jgi:SAM-dependent methyltransferase
MSLTDQIDAEYYEVIGRRSLSERLLVAARDRIYEDFLSHCRPTSTHSILDVGVSDIVNDGANLLERKYPHPQRITAVGLSAASAFRAAFPAVRYRRIEPGRPLPFADRSFDLAVSNAVLEHVGSGAEQIRFVADILRVAKVVFITVPNRYFPVEHHTAIPLLHFWDATFAPACRLLDKAKWAKDEQLILMCRQRLSALVPNAAHAMIGYTGFRLGPFSSNLFLRLEHADGG